MAKDDSYNGQFSLEEIIAEIKVEQTMEETPPSAISAPLKPKEQEQSGIPEWKPKRQSEKKPEVPHIAPKPSAKAVQIKTEDKNEELPPKAVADTEEKPRSGAPWRTKRREPDEFDTREIPKDIENLGEQVSKRAKADKKIKKHKEEKPILPYDFINIPFEDAAHGVNHCDKKVKKLSVRLLFLAPIFLLSLYMSLSPAFSLPMPPGFGYVQKPYIFVLILCGLQCAAMLLASDVISAGIWRLFKLRPTLDTLVAFSSLCALAHAVSIIIMPKWGGYLPYTCVSIFTCFAATFSKRHRALSLKRAYKAVQMGITPVAVKTINDGKNRIAVKTEVSSYCDTEHLMLPDRTEEISQYYAPIAIVFSIAAAAVASFAQGRETAFLWCLAAITSAITPAGLLISSTSPWKRIVKKLFSSGSVLLNNKTARELSACRFAVVTDMDVFPAGAVQINGMKIEPSHKMESVVAASAALMQQIGGGLSRTFTEFARQQYIAVPSAKNIRYFETGGFSGYVNSDYIMIGTASFLMRMGIRVTEGIKLKNGVFVAVNSNFAGVFSVKYKSESQPEAAFSMLRHGHIMPILALRDFNSTQASVEGRFDLRADSTDYPELSKRIDYSEQSSFGEAPPLALLSRNSMLTYAEVITGAKRLRHAIRFNLITGFLAALSGIMLLYFLSANMEAAAITPYNVLLFNVLWALPVWLRGSILSRF